MLKRLLNSKMFAPIKVRFDHWVNTRLTHRGNRVVLNSHSVYVLPTRFGFILAAILFVLMLNAMNYENSMAFMLTFLLAGIALLGMHYTFANLSGLELSPGKSVSIFAGEQATVTIYASKKSRRPRYALFLGESHQAQPANSIEDHEGELKYLSEHLPRGIHTLDRTRIWTVFPFGLFYAWSWFRLKLQIIVYPEPKSIIQESTFGNASSGGNHSQEKGDDVFSGIRRHQLTDSPNRIAWKAMAHSQELLSKEFTATLSEEVWLNFNQLDTLSTEDRLSQLCYWVLECEKQKLHYGLILPTNQIEVSVGEAHKKRCLEALAYFNQQVDTVTT